MDITVVLRSETKYGRDLIYPVNRVAKLLAMLTGKKTFTYAMLDLITELGFRIVWEVDRASNRSNPDPEDKQNQNQ